MDEGDESFVEDVTVNLKKKEKENRSSWKW